MEPTHSADIPLFTSDRAVPAAPPSDRSTSARRAATHKGKRRRRGTPQQRAASADITLSVVDAALAGCVFVVPLLMGGRHPIGHFALVLLALVAGGAWLARQLFAAEPSWRHSPAQWLLAAGIAVLLLQIVPLPYTVLRWLSPQAAHLLPMWMPSAETTPPLGVWNQISLAPGETRCDLMLLVAYALVFLVCVQRIDDREDVFRLLRWCAWSAVAIGCFGLVQYLWSNGKFFWFYENPFRGTDDMVRGSFTNHNHFAHFLALGIGPLVWWLLSPDQSSRRTAKSRSELFRTQTSTHLKSGLRLVGLAAVGFALLLSLSRGGTVAAVAASVVCFAACYRARAVSLRLAASIAAAVVLLGALLSVFGYQQVATRLDTLTSGSLEELDATGGRRTIWKTVLKAIPDFAALGSGAGSHLYVHPIYLEVRNRPIYFTHAENGPLQVALETGLPGLTLVVFGIVLCAWWCWRAMRSSRRSVVLAAGAVAAALAASVVHSLVDFVWYVPGCMVVAAILAACGCRLAHLSAVEHAAGSDRTTTRLPRPLAAVLLLTVAASGVWMLNSALGRAVAQPYIDRYLLLERADTAGQNASSDAAAGAEQDDQPTFATDPQQLAENERSKLSLLLPAVRWNPDDAETHQRLAACYLRLFHYEQQLSDNAMPLGQIRDAAAASGFASREQLDAWLDRAIGPRRQYLDAALAHSRAALRLCPLLGESYLFLGELCFLQGPQSPGKVSYVAQALRVRPHDGIVLFQAGNEALTAGDYERGFACWQAAFRSGRLYQERVARQLVGRLWPADPAMEARFFLQLLHPDLEGLRLLHRQYEQFAQPEQLAELRTYYAQQAEQAAAGAEPEQAASLWLEAMLAYKKLQRPADRLRCARNAFEHDPNNYHVRYYFGDCLADLGLFAEAERHIRWCLNRNPGNKTLEQKLHFVLQRRMATAVPGTEGNQNTKVY